MHVQSGNARSGRRKKVLIMIALVYKRWQCFLSNFEDQVDKKIISEKYTKLIHVWFSW